MRGGKHSRILNIRGCLGNVTPANVEGCLYWHVSHNPKVDPALLVVSVRDNPVWRSPSGRPHLAWL